MEKIKETKPETKKPEVKKELAGKLVFENKPQYQVREVQTGNSFNLLVFIKRGQKILVRLLPAIPKNV